MMVFGPLLRTARTDARLSVAEIGRLLAMTAPNLSRIELGRRGPLADKDIATVASHLGVDAGPLYEAARHDRAERASADAQRRRQTRTQAIAA